MLASDEAFSQDVSPIMKMREAATKRAGNPSQRGRALAEESAGRSNFMISERWSNDKRCSEQ
jgi:hypothetical protein